ncbi:RNHCP domain-containing protein [Patescibacteria group bacterium]|nr:MAG: RNHCP domain-containing protein [Patescibacteria group bacterium]
MTSRKFQRTKEDFTCERCGFFVRGSGYTNHCPQCLWSKHVDVNPGDREARCQGLMEPVGVELKGGEYTILHRCVSCGFEKRNKAAKDDNFTPSFSQPPEFLISRFPPEAGRRAQ